MNRFSATLLGGLIGAGIAMLLAPESGPSTRRKLRSNVDQWQGRAQDQLRHGRMRVTELVRSGQQLANDWTTRAERELPERLEQTRSQIDEAAERAERRINEGPPGPMS